MFGFFTPRYINEARDLLKSAHKLLCYKKDLWGAEVAAAFEAQMRKLSVAIHSKDEKAVEEESVRLDEMAGKQSPPPKDAGMRENCEVLLVAIVIALGVRTYFLQPFTIPTGSMQPTLNGIIGHKTSEPPPNLIRRVGEAIVLGRSYVNVVCEEDGIIHGEKLDKDSPEVLVEYQQFRFFTYTRFHCGSRTYTVPMPASTLMQYFGVIIGKEYKKGELIARGYVDTGDHVFVDKFTYNFRSPRRGDVFVFNTLGIPTDGNRGVSEATSQFYIKRIGGLPSDTLRIASPYLYQNGVKAVGYGYERVMNAQGGYRGYGQGFFNQQYLVTPEDQFSIPAKCYFALGDNSYNSSDSRYWGTVPQRNIMGKALLVYWPFASHWGTIK